VSEANPPPAGGGKSRRRPISYGFVLAHHSLRWLRWRAGVLLVHCLFIGLALVERPRTAWRRRRGAKPRLLWGPSAILNNKHWSEAMRAIGYESLTCIDVDSTITTRKDWDAFRDEFLGGRFSVRLRTYAMFAWAMRHADVFLFYFDGGYLRSTPLAWREYSLLRLAGKKLVFSPFGSDIAVPEYLGRMREPTLAQYPQMVELAPLLKRRVDHSLEWADVAIKNITIGYLPAYDVVWLTQLAIDTDVWKPDGGDSGSDGRSEPVVVLSAPNHRRINGTHHLEQAVGQLRDEGLKIDLRILERRPNVEIREALHAADIVADQFLDPGYGLFPIETMAAGKPMLTRMSPIPEVLWTEALRACPLVDTNPENLRDQLRRLVSDPQLRRDLGAAGREFAVKYHSHGAVAREWEAVIDHAWRGAPLPARLKPPSTRDGQAQPSTAREHRATDRALSN
jgi:glycosyltransferase involved in cell wall biosynthesis